MSFCGAENGIRTPGKICGDACCGLCERVCISTFKVFDAGIIQRKLTDQTISLSNIDPPNPALPLTYVSSNTASSTGIITNLSVVPFGDRPNFSRVTGDVIASIQTNYTDANGVSGKGFTTISLPFDVVLAVPTGSLVPIEFLAVVNGNSTIGRYVDDSTFVIDMCFNIIIKCGANVDIMVPSYGYCLIPRAIEYAEDVCRGFFNKPLYPNNNQ